MDVNGEMNGQTFLYVILRFTFCQCANPSHRKEQDVESPDDVCDKFYKKYLEEAGEYDKKFMKKYEEDLGNTLIFVCCPHHSGTHALIRVSGWSVLRRRFRLYRRNQF